MKMDKRTAFEHMVLSIATIETLRRGWNNGTPAGILASAMRITDEQFSEALAEQEIDHAAGSWVIYQSEPAEMTYMPDWLENFTFVKTEG